MIHDLTLEEIGLGKRARLILYLISLLPFVGVVIGVNYAFRRNAATRVFGWRLLFFAIAIHFIYACCLCPASLLLALNSR